MKVRYWSAGMRREMQADSFSSLTHALSKHPHCPPSAFWKEEAGMKDTDRLERGAEIWPV